MSENLKQTLQTIISTSMTIDKALEDKHITALEWAQIAIKSIGFWKVIKNIQPIKEEFMALTPESKAELVHWVNQNFDLRNHQLEETIEKVFTIAIEIADVFFTRIEFSSENK